MTGGDRNGRPEDVVGAPVDFDRLDAIAARLGSDDRFVETDLEPEFAPRKLVCTYDLGFYPTAVHDARLELTWYQNGDFSIHYHESHESRSYDYRWDRNPSDHNDRDHVHPGPDAPTPGRDASHPTDWRDVLATVLEEIEERQRGFWTD